ncbi:MAG: hypothetical protein Q9185_002250 [Variospora sp. 1 TL-2023]
MSSLGTYSALETLLILQGFQSYSPGSLSLEDLSRNLKSSDIVSRGATFHKEHFEPKALQSLYIRLLKEEIKLDNQRNDGDTRLPHEEQGFREPELSSPVLDTIEEVSHYSRLLPQLATRIYENYRESAIKLIGDEEVTYRLLQKDIQEIERGEWDARLQQPEPTSRTDSKGLSSIQTLLQDEPDSSQPPSKTVNGTSSAPLPSICQQLPDKGTPPLTSSNALIWENQSKAVPHTNGQQKSTPSSDPGPPPPNPSATAVGSPARPRQPFYPPHDPPPNTPRPSSQPASAESGVAFFPPLQPTPQPSQQGFHVSSPPSDIHHRNSSQPTNIAPSPTARPHQAPLPPPERSSGSPIILPPPPGMLRTTSSSSGPLDALSDVVGHPYRAGAVSSPRPSQASNGPQHPVQLPLPSNYPHRGYQYPPYDSRTPYQNAFAPYHPAPMPPFHPHHHTHASPYQHPTHASGQSPHYPPRTNYQPPMHAYPQYSPYKNIPPYTPLGSVASPYAPYPPPRTLDPQTPLSASDGRRKHPKPSPINTSLSSTKWKNTNLPRGFRSPKSPIQPRPDEISPISDRAPSPVLGRPGLQDPNTGRHADAVPSIRKNLLPPSDRPPPAKPRRGRPPRGTNTRGRGARAPSTASSTFPTRTRSASVISGADELSLEPPTSVANRPSIKPEPVATPARESSASMPPSATTDNEANRKSTRRRRETLRGIESAAESTRIGTKRKRTATDASELGPPFPIATSFAFDKQREQLSATHILASRNLPRTSATLINDITAHKLASIFAKPITEREAPGYRSLIFRPQDLKSIKQAITNGNRALTSIVDQENAGEDDNDAVVPVAGASESDMRVWVRRSEDVVPPKGIVNSVQLEREIVRVFANAVMFNPDPDRGLGPSAFLTGAAANKVKERHVPVHLAADNDEAEDEDENGDEEEREREREEQEGGVVRDAREMFEDVERVVGQWRAAEKAAEEAAAEAKTKGAEGKDKEDEEEADELAGESSGGIRREEEGAGGRFGKKRRK